jgi:hypothetical protein
MKRIIIGLIFICAFISTNSNGNIPDDINKIKREGNPVDDLNGLTEDQLKDRLALQPWLGTSAAQRGNPGNTPIFIGDKVADDFGKVKESDETTNWGELTNGNRSLEDVRAERRDEEYKSILIGILVVGILIVLVIFLIKRTKETDEFGKEEENTNKTKQPQNLYEQVMSSAIPLTVNGYRRIAATNSCAPTSKTSDQKIIEIYRHVGSAFKEASKQRNEHIPAGYLNTIVLKFFQVYELGGDLMLDEHLKYEVNKYIRGGLREDYKQELKLF